MKDVNNYSLYRHTSPSGKVYIGITNHPVIHRWRSGKGYLNVLKGPFKSTILKYGWDSIKHEVLFFNLSEDKAKYLEKIFIKIYKNKGNSLNITDGGDGCCGVIPWNKGIKVPFEKSNKRKGCHLTEEHKNKLSAAHRGKTRKGVKWTEKLRNKMKEALKGWHHTEQAKKNISEHSIFAKSVVEKDREGNILHTFKSATEAAKKYDIDPSWVAKSCRNGIECCGHIFMYEDNIKDVSKVLPPHYRTGHHIIIRDICTGEIRDFDSLASCAKFLGYKSTGGLRKQIAKNNTIKGKWRVVDDLSHLASFLRNNTKSALQKQIEG